MYKHINIIVISIFFILVLLSFGFCQETFTITTYYPSPYGSYNQLYVAGNVGIGTTAPVGKLDVNGSLASTAWTAVTFGTGWSNYGSGYQAVQYKKFGDLVFLRGLATSGGSAWASYPTITTLPTGHRPAARLIFDQMANSNQAVRVDITSGGSVLWVAGGAGNNWLSLDSIVFSVD